GGNVGLLARFDPALGNGYSLVIDDGNQWNLNAIAGFQSVAKLNEGDDAVPVDPDTGERINALTDIMIQLDVTGQGTDTLLEVWFWRPGEPMPAEPYFSIVDTANAGADAINEGFGGILYVEDRANSPGIYRFVQASDTHISDAMASSPTPEPASLVLAACGFAALAVRRRWFRRR
ncbi:MAG: PEP-CTERM sorting domain-containing protein, partial [Planctomycetota bacterium]